jgi:hypothetical protein
MDPLLEAIEDVLAFVNIHSEPWQDSEIEQMCEFAERVCSLLPDSLTSHLPQMEEMCRVLESRDPPLPHVQYISKLNLPGDRTEQGFLVEATPWLWDMQKLRDICRARSILEAAKLLVPTEKPPRLIVDLTCRTITLDRVRHDIDSEVALRWVKVLAEHPGEWISAPDLRNYDAELDGCRPHRRCRPYLPAAVLDLIDTDRRKGSRLRLAAC